jgi:hypoxanthine phosphoribosyltransferase
MNNLLKVLIVDDEADARNTLRVFLAEFNQVRGFKIFNSNFTTILA